MRIGIADHLGWAIAVTASDAGSVVDRRRIDLVEPGVAPMPVHHGIELLDDREAMALLAEVRASAVRQTGLSLQVLADEVGGTVTSISLRVWPPDVPTDLATLRRSPWEARADAVMYRQVLADAAVARGWAVRTYEAKDVEARAAQLLGDRTDAVLHGPRATLGPPWTKDHRVALAAAVVAGAVAGAP